MQLCARDVHNFGFARETKVKSCQKTESPILRSAGILGPGGMTGEVLPELLSVLTL